MKDIDHPGLIEEWKLNLDKTEYEKKLDAGENVLSLKEKYIVTIAVNSDQKLFVTKFNGFIFRVLCSIKKII